MDQVSDFPLTEKDMRHKRRSCRPTTKKEKFTTGLLVTLLVALVIASTGLLFCRFYFTTFWVDGQSMYPTLNKNVQDANGKLAGDTVNYDEPDPKKIDPGMTGFDYGIMDTHAYVRQNLKRFDIIVLKYEIGDKEDKIKRVIGLPGDALYFAKDDPDTKDKNENGDLYVRAAGSSRFELIEQPIDEDMIRNGEYPSSTVQVPPDAVYVCGDNRLAGRSIDSRKRGAIPLEFVTGKVLALVATCSLKNGQPTRFRYHWPVLL